MHIKKCFACLACGALLAGAQVVAVIDGKELTRDDVAQILEGAPPQIVQQFRVSPQAALTNYFVMQYLGQEGEARKLADRSPYKEQLEAMRWNILAGALVNDEQNGYRVTDEMINAYYNEHRQQYEQARIKGIYLTFKPAVTSTGTSAEALQRAAQEALAAARAQRSESETAILANEIVKQLRAGADFGKLAEQYSEDQASKTRGGDFGLLKAGGPFPEEVRSAVMALEVGAVSDPIRQPTAYYIVRVEEKVPQPVNEVAADIILTIRQEHLSAFLTDLNRRFSPVVKDAGFFTQAPGAAPVPGQR